MGRHLRRHTRRPTRARAPSPARAELEPSLSPNPKPQPQAQASCPGGDRGGPAPLVEARRRDGFGAQGALWQALLYDSPRRRRRRRRRRRGGPAVQRTPPGAPAAPSLDGSELLGFCDLEPLRRSGGTLGAARLRACYARSWTTICSWRRSAPRSRGFLRPCARRPHTGRTPHALGTAPAGATRAADGPRKCTPGAVARTAQALYRLSDSDCCVMPRRLTQRRHLPRGGCWTCRHRMTPHHP